MDTWQSTGTPDSSGSVRGPRTPAKRRWDGALRVMVFMAAGFLLVALSGCSDDSAVSPVEAAQADVTAKEQALADAEAQATSTADAFCEASSSYITALDRYGDLLNETAPTVGDVKEAGKDLATPGEDAKAAADAAISAREQVTSAEQDLVDAEAALVAVEASAAGETPAEVEPSQVPSAKPAADPETVARVEQAEADFTTAQSGITDDTPLVQAVEQFNAAAVALEVSWLALSADAGCPTDAQQEEAAAAVGDYTVALQKDLADAGFYEGKVDGIYGPETVAAVEALQKANGLPETGTMDKATEEALRTELEAAGGTAADEEIASTAALQQTLKLAGYWDGPVDGRWTPELTDALKEAQSDLGVEPTGEVDAATIAAFEEALVTAQATPAPSASSTTSTRSSTKPSDKPSASA